jgi:hypothetical protein
VDWYSVDLGKDVVWLPKIRFFHDGHPDPPPKLMQPGWVPLRSLWLCWVPTSGEVIDLSYPSYAGDGTQFFRTVFQSVYHLVASLAVFDRYWSSLPQFWQDNTENMIAFHDPYDDAEGDDARETFDSIVIATLRKCLPVWCEINPETADALSFFYEGLLVDLDINPYESGLLSDPDLPKGSGVWDPVAASLIPHSRY